MKSTTVILSATVFLALCLSVVGAMLLLASGLTPKAASMPTATNTPLTVAQVQPTDTLPPTNTPPQAASATLRPAPTFEPPTSTPLPLPSLQPTASPTIGISVELPALHGLETATPTNEGCQPRKDWTLTYTVQRGDALARIAQEYGTYATVLAEGNCLADADVITIGQTLRVPGTAHPVAPEWTCATWEVLTPMDYAYDIAEDGQMTFNWRGSAGKRNLIRVFRDGNIFWERTVDMRQNETITLKSEGFEPGNYTWQVYPLDLSFQQIPCLESPLWHFHIGDRPEPEIPMR